MKRLILLMAVLGALAVAATLSYGSSHREAPNITTDPTGDNTDVYAFVANDTPDSLTIAANWIPFEDPAGGPNFYLFDDKAKYYINVDNTGDGRADLRYLFRFKTRVANPESFLAAAPIPAPVTSLDVRQREGMGLNLRQAYSVTREKMRGDRVTDRDKILSGQPVVPSNIGPKTMPDYERLARQGIRSIDAGKGGGRVFVGQREDPFFVDLGMTFDAINLEGRGNPTGNVGRGKDDLAGYSTNSVVLQVPKEQVTRDAQKVSGPAAGNAVVGVWSSTERKSLEVTSADLVSRRRSSGGTGKDVQVSRLGNPLINEVVIPLGQKDKFNRTTPNDDVKNFGKYVLNPELAKVLNLLFKVNAPESGRDDIVAALLTGLKTPDGANFTQIGTKPAAADTLKINMGVPPTPRGSESRFGVLGGDLAGFPNGRRLTDDVVDIELRVVAGFLKNNKVPLGDGVVRNDKEFRAEFPYLASPTSGLDAKIKRQEGTTPPDPADPNGPAFP